jgi:hypothetical protein
MPSALDGLRATLPIGGHIVELLYRVGTKGCGPVGFELNGSPLPFMRGANPYRTGAADVSMPDIAARLQPNSDFLVVHLG